MAMGEPKGVLMVDFASVDYQERYCRPRLGARGQWVDFSTPTFRRWFDALEAWQAAAPEARDPVPPASINDLCDTRIPAPDDLRAGVHGPRRSILDR